MPVTRQQGLQLCRRCRKRWTRRAVCGTCRERQRYRGLTLHTAGRPTAPSVIPPERIAELKALATDEKPLFPQPRPPDGPRRLETSCHRVHAKH